MHPVVTENVGQGFEFDSLCFISDMPSGVVCVTLQRRLMQSIFFIN